MKRAQKISPRVISPVSTTKIVISHVAFAVDDEELGPANTIRWTTTDCAPIDVQIIAIGYKAIKEISQRKIRILP